MTVRHTARGGDAVEALISRILDEATTALAKALHPTEYLSVVLIGGYGRGEGGVVVVDGEERPHNNFDFLIITRAGSRPAEVKARAVEALGPLSARHAIGMDVGIVSSRHLLGAPCLVMWHDMRFGHRVLLGDPDFVAGLVRFRPDTIVPWDVRNLLVNRGTLLLINELILAKAVLSLRDRQTVIRHAAKAIIGYGDAWLYFLGDYHWSYREKQRRMRSREEIDPAFRRLYDRAAEFRFRPSYSEFASCDLSRWNRALRQSLAGVHLACERLRLRRPDLGWADYAQVAFHAALGDRTASARDVARSLVAFTRRAPHVPLTGVMARLGLRLSPARDRLPLLFPGVAYPAQAPTLAELAAQALGASGDSALVLERAYLRQWGRYGDLNFPAALGALGVSVDREAA